MKLFAVNAGNFKLDGGAMHGVVPKSMWEKKNPADENNMCSWAMRCLLIDTGEKRILIDCGMGDKQDLKFFSRYYLHGNDTIERSLAKHGYTTQDIDELFLSHLHFDHAGGAIMKDDAEQLVPTFPKALYWSDKLHWKTATFPNEREKASFLKENILPIQESGKLNFVESYDGGEWLYKIKIRFMKGHTESMMLPLIPYKNTHVLFCADLFPSAAHISLPWVMAYDMQPKETLKEKEEILKLAADNRWILFFEHDPHIECATVQHTEKGIQIKNTFSLEAIDTYL